MHNLLEQETTRITVKSQSLIVHENYDEATINNDIGVVVLTEEVELNEYVNAIPLPTHDDVSDKYEGNFIDD